MIKIIDLNDTGKTRKLLEECAEHDGVIICEHPEKISEKCSAYNLPIVSAYYYTDYRKTGKRYVYVDEIEKFAKAVIPYMAGYSMTIEEK